MIDQCGEKAVYPDICVNTWSPAAHYEEARGRAGAEEASVIERDPGSVGEDAPAGHPANFCHSSHPIRLRKVFFLGLT